MRLHGLSKALFVTTCPAKPRFLVGSGCSCPKFVQKTEVFGEQNKLISFSLFLMIRFSNKSVFQQPSRPNCLRQPRFDTCLQIITSKKHLDIFYSNLKKHLTSRLYNLTSRLLQKHLNLDENNLKWQLWSGLVYSVK